MDPSSTTVPLTYDTPPRMSPAQRLASWLLIIAAAMFVINGLDFLGLDVRVWFAPATKSVPPHMEWRGDTFSLAFKVWHADPAGSILMASTTATSVALLLLCAWGVHRGARWAAILGIVLSLLLGVPLTFISAAGGVELARGAWAVYHGGSDGIGLGLLQHIWLLCLGLALVLAIKPLWSVSRQKHTSNCKPAPP